jgi:hypothetical protein
MLTVLIAVGIIVLLLIILSLVPFGDSGVARSRERAYWTGGASANPRLRYDPEARFDPPSDSR